METSVASDHVIILLLIQKFRTRNVSYFNKEIRYGPSGEKLGELVGVCVPKHLLQIFVSYAKY